MLVILNGLISWHLSQDVISQSQVFDIEDISLIIFQNIKKSWHEASFDDVRPEFESLKMRIQCNCYIDTPAIQVILEINQLGVPPSVINFNQYVSGQTCSV